MITTETATCFLIICKTAAWISSLETLSLTNGGATPKQATPSRIDLLHQDQPVAKTDLITRRNRSALASAYAPSAIKATTPELPALSKSERDTTRVEVRDFKHKKGVMLRTMCSTYKPRGRSPSFSFFLFLLSCCLSYSKASILLGNLVLPVYKGTSYPLYR